MVHAGHVRYSSEEYIALYLAVHPDFRKHLNELYDSVRYEEMNNLLQCEHDGRFTYKPLDDFRKELMYVELEQNIFRSKIRNFNNHGPVKVYLFATEKKIIRLLKTRFKNCTIREIEIPLEFANAKFVSKKRYADFAQQLLNYIDSKFKRSKRVKNIPVTEIKQRFNINHRTWNYLINEQSDFKLCLKLRDIRLVKDPKSRRQYLTNAP